MKLGLRTFGRLASGMTVMGLLASMTMASRAETFLQTNTIVIPANQAGAANPYPSSLSVTGVNGFITKAAVTLSNLTHTWPSDVDVLLVSPGGQRVLLMSDAGADLSINNVTLTFDDAAPSSLPLSSRLMTGSFKPTNHPGEPDLFPGPAPSGPYGTSLSVLQGQPPSGTWQLYVADALAGDGGSVSGGWSLTLIVTNELVVPAVRVNDVSVPESSQGTAEAVFIVSLSSTSGVPVSVDFGTVDGTATAGLDYVARFGTLLFSPGATQQTVSVTLVGDSFAETTEQFRLLLSHPLNAVITDAEGVATITDDDSVQWTDAWAGRPVLSTTPLAVTGNNLGSTKEAGEPAHAGMAGGHSVWMSWRAPFSGAVNVDIGVSTFSALLAVYTGPDVANLVPVADNQTENGLGSRLTFNAVSNMTYDIVLDSLDGEEGEFFIVLRLKPGQFNVASQARPEVWVPNGPVLAMVEVGGVIYLGGEFTHLSPNVGKGELRESLSGVAVPGFPRANGPVYTAVSDGQGGWYLGGEFTRIGSVTRTNLAHVLENGQVDPNFNAWADGFVFELAMAEDRLYVGGTFTRVSGESRKNVAALALPGGVLTEWQPVVRHAQEPQVASAVRAIVVESNRVFVGGIFTEAGGSLRQGLAALDADTGAATAWNPSPTGTGEPVIQDLALQDSALYVAGSFASIGGSAHANLAAIDLDTGAATSWAPSIDDGPVLSMDLSCDTVYVGGRFTSVNDQPRSRLAAVRLDDGQLTDWNPEVTGPEVARVALSQGLVYAGGTFTAVSGQARDNVVAVDAATGVPTDWNPGSGIDVQSLSVAAGKVFVGSVHDRGGISRHNIAAVDSQTGEPIWDWNPGTDGPVTAMDQTSGLLVIGGDFMEVGGVSRQRLAAVGLDSGAVHENWNPGADNTPLAIRAGVSQVIVGGRFNYIGGAPRRYLASLDTFNGAAHNWQPIFNGEVRDVGWESDLIYVAGAFTTVDFSPRTGFALIHRITGALLPWSVNVQGTGMVGEAIGIFSTGANLGGTFTMVQGQSRTNLASVDKVTGSLLPWNPVVGPEGRSVTTLARWGEYHYIGGSFEQAGGMPRNGLAAIEDLSGQTMPWDPILKAPRGGTVVSALSTSEERVGVGGSFTTIGGRFSPNFAIFAPEGAPRILQEPLDQSLPVGGTLQIEAEVGGQYPVSFQWRLEGTNLPQATQSALTISNAQGDQAGTYSLVVSNGLGQTRSRSVEVVVFTPPGIVSGPSNQTVAPGDTVTLTVQASGLPSPSFQWRRNGVNIPGAVFSEYTIPNAMPGDGGSYQVVVANLGGAVLSEVATVLVSSSPLPFSDDLAERGAIAGATGVGSGSNVTATKPLGEPRHGGHLGGRSVWLEWQAPTNGIATFSSRGSGFDTLLAVYTNLGSLTLVAEDDDRAGFGGSLVTFNAVAGVDYLIAVDGFSGASGDIVLSWDLDTSTVPLPRILGQPASQTVVAGQLAAFTVAVLDTNSVRYQWFFGCLALADATNATLILPKVRANQVGGYRVLVMNDSSRVTESIEAALEIGPVPSVQSQDKVEDELLASPLSNPVSGASRTIASLAPVPFVSVSVGTTDAQLFNNTGSQTQLGEPIHCDVFGGASKSFDLLAEGAATFVIDTIGSRIDTVLAVYYRTGLLYLAHNLVACDNNGAPDGIRSRVRFASRAGQVYRAYVDGAGGAQGDIALNWKLGHAPSFASTSPIFHTARQGSPVTLRAELSGSFPASYFEWRRDGVVIAGATTETLVLNSVQSVQGGTYSAVAWNDFGSNTNTVAVLTVEIPYLTFEPGVTDGLFRIWLQGGVPHALVLQNATDLSDWTPIYTNAPLSPTRLFAFPLNDPPARFFRARPGP